MLRRILLGLIGIVLVIAVIVLVDDLLRSPSHDRNWPDYYARTPDAALGTSTVVLRNVRNWNHSRSEVLSREWLDAVALNPDEITRVWYSLIPFSNSFVGHSFVSFEFADGNVYTISIEARREVGEEYNLLLGFINEFDLWYGWGTERDFLGVSLFLLDRPLEMYPLELSEEQRALVFRSMAAATAEVAAEPRFYNTLTANCTNLLAKAINQASPSALPYNLAWNFPGVAPQYLFEQGLIDTDTTDVDILRAESYVTDETEGLLETINGTPQEFSRVLRSVLADAQ